MAESKDAILDTTSYGPSAPPPSAGARHNARLHCNPYNLFRTIFKAVTMVLIVIAVVVLVLWLVYQPDDLKVYVDRADATQFNLTKNGSLYYNLTFDVSIRNPNKMYDVYYERLEADGFYDGSMFASEILPEFKQGSKSTDVVHISFNGRAPVSGDTIAADFNREMGDGYFSVALKMYTRIKLKIFFVKTSEYTPDIDCYLKIPSPGNTSSLGRFNSTTCHVESF